MAALTQEGRTKHNNGGGGGEGGDEFDGVTLTPTTNFMLQIIMMRKPSAEAAAVDG